MNILQQSKLNTAKSTLSAKYRGSFAAGVRIYRIWKSRMTRYLHATLQLHNSPVDCARELFKHSKDSASLRDCTEEKIV